MKEFEKAKLLSILTEPNPILRKQSETIEKIDESIKELTYDMLKTLYHSGGIGLAAPQIGVSKKLIVIDIDYTYIVKALEWKNEEIKNYNPFTFNFAKLDKSITDKFLHNGKPLIIINPEIKEKSAEYNSYEEGCLSIPGVYYTVNRPQNIQVAYYDLDGNKIEKNISNDLLTVCIQHEMDHLDGRLFIDYLSKIKKDFAIKKSQKFKTINN